jgi:hypothetical protein
MVDNKMGELNNSLAKVLRFIFLGFGRQAKKRGGALG